MNDFVIDYGVLGNIICKMECGENIKIFDYNNIVIKRKDKSLEKISSPFKTEEEYNDYAKKMILKVKEKYGTGFTTESPILSFLDGSKEVKIVIIDKYITENNRYMFHIRKLYPV